MLRTSFTGGAEALDGGSDGRRGGCFGLKFGERIEGLKRAGAPEVRAHWSGFCLWGLRVPRSLTLMVSEEICGRFGSFDEQSTAYRGP